MMLNAMMMRGRIALKQVKKICTRSKVNEKKEEGEVREVQ